MRYFGNLPLNALRALGAKAITRNCQCCLSVAFFANTPSNTPQLALCAFVRLCRLWRRKFGSPHSRDVSCQLGLANTRHWFNHIVSDTNALDSGVDFVPSSILWGQNLFGY